MTAIISTCIDFWHQFSGNPLVGLTLTLAAYQIGVWLFKKSHYHTLANPVLIAIIIITPILLITGTPYSTYFDGAKLIHFLLGPATVALAIPLFSYWKRLQEAALPICVALFCGSATAVGSAMLIAKIFGASPETIASLAPKSVTTPIAMSVSESIGGLPSLTAVLVILTGILGAVCFTSIFRLLRINNHAAQGLAIGLTSHGLGTARAFMVSDEMGTFSALGMGLNGIITAFLLPILLHR